MPDQGTLNDKSKYVYDQLEAAHPEIEWGVSIVKFSLGKLSET